MDISKITNGGLPLQPLKGKKATDDSEKVRSTEDRADISAEATTLFQSTESKRLEEVRSRVENGYYLQHQVTEKVVDALMRDLSTT